jgi:hypothetical protein
MIILGFQKLRCFGGLISSTISRNVFAYLENKISWKIFQCANNYKIFENLNTLKIKRLSVGKIAKI